MWWKKNKRKVIVPVAVAAILAAAFWYGGGAPGLQGWTVQPPASQLETPQEASPEIPEEPAPTETPETPTGSIEPEQPAEGFTGRPGGPEGGHSAADKIALAEELAGGSASGAVPGDEAYSEAHGMVIDPSTGKDKYQTDPVPAGKPLPVEPQNAAISDTAYTCTLSISCATILEHMDWLDPEKVELVPADGWILPSTQVTFYEGESVFNVLQRTCKQNKIHMEFKNTPMYNSAYIEGIHNLYEFDCGELSGWKYKVNEWFPNYGCSRYQLKEGDVVCWEYTCDLGADIGGFYAAGG